MKRTPLLLIAMLPFMASAGAGGGTQMAEVDQEKLRNAVPVTEIVGQDVETRDGEEFGEVETVAFKQDGSVAYYAIEPEMDWYEEADMSFDADADALEARVDDPDLDELIYVQPDKIAFEDGGNIVKIDMEGNELMQGQSRNEMATSGNLLDATDIVGMEVDLADAESFGEVEDVMIGQDGKEAVALVVDNWDGANKERRALPVALESANLEDESIRYDFSRDALSETGNFELEQYMDDM
ncbi:MAG TPA: PRC-barrel domain-containing protein [Gammaproteobacteria bacterium]